MTRTNLKSNSGFANPLVHQVLCRVLWVVSATWALEGEGGLRGGVTGLGDDLYDPMHLRSTVSIVFNIPPLGRLSLMP